MSKFIRFLVLSLLLFSACRTPPPGEVPPSTLVFQDIEASGVHQMVLYFRLEIENPRPNPLISSIQNWSVSISGVDVNAELTELFIVREEAPQAQTGINSLKIPLETQSHDATEIRLALHLDLRSEAEMFRPTRPQDEDYYQIELNLGMAYQYGASRPFSGKISGIAVFPRISEPELVITSIAILQAELINTRFRVNLQINNRNAFPVTLSAFKYELYGDGLFWASGEERDVFHIPAKGSAETRLFLLMNFINMRRGLLDEIIALRRVNYRFSGEAEVDIEVPWLPRFRMNFDRSGLSEVFS